VGAARIKVEFNLSHHGGSNGRIICDTADTGSLQVSGTLLGSLIALGVTGFPSVDVARVRTGTATVGSGQAELKVYSDSDFIAEIPGLTSCEHDGECPTGQTCQSPGNRKDVRHLVHLERELPDRSDLSTHHQDLQVAKVSERRPT
jgi:hypothetical protein